MQLINGLPPTSLITSITFILFNYLIGLTNGAQNTKTNNIKFPEDDETSLGRLNGKINGNVSKGGPVDESKEFGRQGARYLGREEDKGEIEDLRWSFDEDLLVDGKGGSRRGKVKGKEGGFSYGETAVQRVTFTQRGYIQFLKYVVEVPAITEFTFCIWLRSYNLTYAHPLLSYSKHEEDRYIRVWISSLGEEISLAIMEFEVFKIPIKLKEYHWYHICQSWDASSGAWAFYLNGKLRANGQELTLQGLEIPAGGDMVVGQEYTDFDKGLDDGIEGDIYGFNFVLSPASGATYRPSTTPMTSHITYTATRNPIEQQPSNSYHLTNEIDSALTSNSDNRRNIIVLPQRKYMYSDPGTTAHAQHGYDMVDVYSGLQQKVPQGRNGVRLQHDFPYRYQVHKDIASVTQVPYIYKPPPPPTELTPSYDVPEVLSYFTTLGLNRQPKGFIDFTGNILHKMFNNIFTPTYNKRKSSPNQITIDRNGNVNTYDSISSVHQKYLGVGHQNQGVKLTGQPKRVFKGGGAKNGFAAKTLGMALVEFGYGNCALGKGSPVFDDRVLIGWMKTPVRVFGGATLHTEAPFCV